MRVSFVQSQFQTFFSLGRSAAGQSERRTHVQYILWVRQCQKVLPFESCIWLHVMSFNPAKPILANPSKVWIRIQDWLAYGCTFLAMPSYWHVRLSATPRQCSLAHNELWFAWVGSPMWRSSATPVSGILFPKSHW